MSHDLPDDWYEDHDGQRLVLNSKKVAAELSRLRKALTEIAAFDDEYGNKRLAANGSYSAFDEPCAVQVARDALDAGQPPKHP